MNSTRRSLVHSWLSLFLLAGFLFYPSLAQTSNELTGKASWYNFKPGFFAASTIYPKGQTVRVHHLATGKFVDVIINDYGPDPIQHPDRVIDLQKEAFLELATLGTGVISVRLEPLLITPTTNLVRDLNKERIALQQFTQRYGRLPSSDNDWQIIHHLAYNTTITESTLPEPSLSESVSLSEPVRDLNKERIALQQFTQRYGRLPSSDNDWQIIHQIAYNQVITNWSQLNLSDSEVAAVVVMDANNQVVWQKNQQAVLPIASLTKIIAVKTFLDTQPSFNQIVQYRASDEQEIAKYCRPEEAARIRLKDGDLVKIQDLVYSALVGSANNAVESLVRISGLSRDQFIQKMNNNVREWGAINTRLVEPTGLSTNNVSTVQDYALILKQVSQDQQIQKITTTLNYQFETINAQQQYNIKNTNKLLSENKWPIQSSKTGYLNEAGYCLAMSIQGLTTDQQYTVVTLGSPSWEVAYQINKQLLSIILN